MLGTGTRRLSPRVTAARCCCEPGRLSGCAASTCQELDVWTTDFVLPATVWLAGFFNPQSFLTAIMQSMARKNEWPLDKMCLTVDVTKKYREEITAPPREGSFVHGLFMEGKNGSFYEMFQMENAQPWEFLRQSRRWHSQAQLNLYSSCESSGQRGRCWVEFTGTAGTRRLRAAPPPRKQLHKPEPGSWQFNLRSSSE